MKVKVLLYMGLLIALAGCTGMVLKDEPSPSKSQTIKYSEDNSYQTKSISNPRAKSMIAWIELSKD